MSTDEWPSEQELRERLTALVSSPTPPRVAEWSGTVYRFASRAFADLGRFTDGEGARRNGGRFTPIGGPRTVYLALDRATAVAELDSWHEYYGIPDSAFTPRVFAAVGVCVGPLLDLTGETLSHLGLTPGQIGAEWRAAADAGSVAPTQLFGRLAYEAGFEGVRFPSARREGGWNLALFPERYRSGSHAVMLNHAD